MSEAQAILVRAREAAQEAAADHCGCCDNPEEERIARKAIVDMLGVAKNALQCVRDLDDSALGVWSWEDHDECPLAIVTDMQDDMRKTLDKRGPA